MFKNIFCLGGGETLIKAFYHPWASPEILSAVCGERYSQRFLGGLGNFGAPSSTESPDPELIAREKACATKGEALGRLRTAGMHGPFTFPASASIHLHSPPS